MKRNEIITGKSSGAGIARLLRQQRERRCQLPLVADGEPLADTRHKRRTYETVALPPGFVAECPVVTGRRWRFDYAWPDKMVALEIEGGFFGKGKPCEKCGRREVAGHSSIQRIKSDMTKYNVAAAAGWKVFRCLPQEFKSGEAAAMIAKVLTEKTA